MKPVHHQIATKEDRENIPSVGTSIHPATNYTKDDFLTPARVAKKFGITTKQATDLMKKLAFNRAVFILNGHKSPIIIRLNGSIHLHPMAFDVFQQQINNQKAK